MTTETNTSVLNTFKDAFAPVTDALKNFQNSGSAGSRS